MAYSRHGCGRWHRGVARVAPPPRQNRSATSEKVLYELRASSTNLLRQPNPSTHHLRDLNGDFDIHHRHHRSLRISPRACEQRCVAHIPACTTLSSPDHLLLVAISVTFILGRVYSCTMLYLLNNRSQMSGEMPDGTVEVGLSTAFNLGGICAFLVPPRPSRFAGRLNRW
jgi:hypothetical protein